MTEDQSFSKRYSEPMTLATFEAFEVFLDFLTILQLFDNFSTGLSSAPLPVSTPSNLSIIWVALVDKSVNELVLSIEVSRMASLLNL